MNLEPLKEPPLGMDAIYLMRVSLLKPDGTLTGCFQNKREIILPHYGYFIDDVGLGAFCVTGNNNYADLTLKLAKRREEFGDAYMQRNYRYQVITAWRCDVGPRNSNIFCRIAKRGFVLFTADEIHARFFMDLLLRKYPSATHDLSDYRRAMVE